MNDRILKYKLIDNILSIVLPKTGVPDVRWNKVPDADALGNFELLLDEELTSHEENGQNQQRERSIKLSTSSNRWK